METTLSKETTQDLFRRVAEANLRFARLFPGEPASRQPVHTVYGGAQLFKKDLAPKLGKGALRSLEAFAPDARTFSEALGLTLDPALSQTVYDRVIEKLKPQFNACK